MPKTHYTVDQTKSRNRIIIAAIKFMQALEAENKVHEGFELLEVINALLDMAVESQDQEDDSYSMASESEPSTQEMDLDGWERVSEKDLTPEQLEMAQEIKKPNSQSIVLKAKQA